MQSNSKYNQKTNAILQHTRRNAARDFWLDVSFFWRMKNKNDTLNLIGPELLANEIVLNWISQSKSRYVCDDKKYRMTLILSSRDERPKVFVLLLM